MTESTRRSLILAAAGAAVLVPAGAQALIPHPNDPAFTAPPDLSGLVGKKLRVVRPGEAITMDYSPERVTIEVDEAGKILRAAYG